MASRRSRGVQAIGPRARRPPRGAAAAEA